MTKLGKYILALIILVVKARFANRTKLALEFSIDSLQELVDTMKCIRGGKQILRQAQQKRLLIHVA